MQVLAMLKKLEASLCTLCCFVFVYVENNLILCLAGMFLQRTGLCDVSVTFPLRLLYSFPEYVELKV